MCNLGSVKLPPGIKNPGALPLLKTRNVRPTLGFQAGIRYLHDTGLPSLNRPANFIDLTLNFEKQLGTAQAALIGLHLASGINRINDVVEGLGMFQDIVQQIASQHDPRTSQGMYMFQHKLGPRLKFASSKQNIYQGLNALQTNLALADLSLVKEVGNSIVCSALFSLIILAANGLAGEGHDIVGRHSFSYLPVVKQIYIYDNTRLNPPHFYILDTDKLTVLTSAFSFIATLIIAQASSSFPRKGEVDFSLLDTAEAINPFYLQLFRLRAGFDKESNTQENLIIANEIRNILNAKNIIM